MVVSGWRHGLGACFLSCCRRYKACALTSLPESGQMLQDKVEAVQGMATGQVHNSSIR